MAKLRFRRRPRVKSARTLRTAPPVPEATGLSGAARRVNRLVAAVALLGAFGTVALAVALTPGAQQSASVANASQGTLAVSEVATQPAVIEIATPPQPVIATPPEPVVAALLPGAAKSDRLFRTPQGERPAKADLAIVARPQHSIAPRDPGARDFAMAARRPAVEGTSRSPDRHFGAGRERLEFGLSVPPVPGETMDETGAGAVEDPIEEAVEPVDAEQAVAVIEAAAEAIDEAAAEEAAIEAAVEEPSKEAEPEVAVATRTAPVTTDVNMRAGPDNGAAVIQVVPRNREVEVIGCDYWCEVIYAGKRGYIYKGFVRGSKS